MDNNQPIIVKRVSRKADGHHGGSWKIAFADFAVAMMAFFLVMWLLATATPEQLKMVSGYFQDPIGFSEGGSPYVIDLGGAPELAPQRTLQESAVTDPVPLDPESIQELADELEQQQLDLLLQELQNQIDIDPVLQRFKDQILLEITQDGLRIQIVDAENRPMFASGSARLQPYFEEILLALSDTIARVPKKISISGHTDAQPFVARRDYGNWELSADRANAARRTLLAAGYPEQQLARVVGFADSALFDRSNPLNPVNRRIDIVVLNKRAEEQMLDGVSESAYQEQDAQVPLDVPVSGERIPGGRSLNLFEEGGSLEQLRGQ
ncbi:flagellar motor protein MotB [Halopseudomonas phragmitis]|uniref:Flagellar motor protein MotB n=2 Tax=Pseudomonadaceae TaxID=135621 RepID=A0A1V0B4M9_9GAMM|nr:MULTISPECIES: flagellar motor protein MotB [Pseudomonadaceae]AQZ94851.1 flagellar motor protein MotB [Halopseudomonas phragmitis]RHW23011.1 motility protein MotB [Pseudomonas jilinensis]